MARAGATGSTSGGSVVGAALGRSGRSGRSGNEVALGSGVVGAVGGSGVGGVDSSPEEDVIGGGGDIGGGGADIGGGGGDTGGGGDIGGGGADIGGGGGDTGGGGDIGGGGGSGDMGGGGGDATAGPVVPVDGDGEPDGLEVSGHSPGTVAVPRIRSDPAGSVIGLVDPKPLTPVGDPTSDEDDPKPEVAGYDGGSLPLTGGDWKKSEDGPPGW